MAAPYRPRQMGAGARPATEVRASAEGLGGGRDGGADSRASAGDAVDAGDGDRRADRLGEGHDDPQGPDPGTAAGPAYVPVDPVLRTTYRPGELAQCDLWFPDADIPLGYGQSGCPPALVMVSGYSRVITARMLP